jgi:hypothetical protein
MGSDLYAPIHRHLNIGAGRIVWQDIVRIDVSIKKRQFHKAENIVASCQRSKDENGRFHLIGLVKSLFPRLSETRVSRQTSCNV